MGESGKIDLFELLEQTVDAAINSTMRAELEKSGDEYTMAALDLLTEYGISGRKAIEFAYKLDTLYKLYNP